MTGRLARAGTSHQALKTLDKCLLGPSIVGLLTTFRGKFRTLSMNGFSVMLTFHLEVIRLTLKIIYCPLPISIVELRVKCCFQEESQLLDSLMIYYNVTLVSIWEFILSIIYAPDKSPDMVRSCQVRMKYKSWRQFWNLPSTKYSMSALFSINSHSYLSRILSCLSGEMTCLNMTLAASIFTQ